MAKNLRLRIADIVFSIRFPADLNNVFLDANYLSFISKEKASFSLIVKTGHPYSASFLGPPRGASRFVTPTWDYWKSGGRYVFRFFSFQSSKPFERILFLKSDKSGEIFIPQVKKLSRNPFSYPLDEILTITLLAAQCGSLIHSCGIRYKDKGYLFIGSSGAGKSTLSLLLKDNALPLRKGRDIPWDKATIDILSDDRVIAKKKDKQFHIYGTPWSGTAGLTSHQAAPLSILFFLKKDKKNSLHRLSYGDTASRLIKYSFLPFWDRERLNSCLAVSQAMAEAIPAFEFSFTPDNKAVDLLSKEILT